MKNIDVEPPGFYGTQPTSLLNLIPETPKNRYFYENGFSKLIPRLTLRVHSDIEECFYLWDKFSPKKSLFDLWDFRYSWYQGHKNKPYFYTLYEGKTPLALLPLCFDARDKKRYEWFGTNWMEDNAFFVKDDSLIDLLYGVFPTPIHLNAIEAKAEWRDKPIVKRFQKDDPKNLKNISGTSSIEDLLSAFQKKHRYNLKSDYQEVQSLNPKIVVTEGKNLDLIEILIQMNIDQFSDRAGDESDLVVPKRAETYRYMIKNSGIYGVKFIQVFIQNRLAGIDFVIEYKDIYYTIKGGIDVHRFKGVSNFMVYFEFEDAIAGGFSSVDCLQIDYGWKHRYFDQKEVFIFEK
ncbi:hypothetical protein HYT33_04380 [Candidatus Roizmanbacteria bacterium]|nr:hypothetical protein [Candidatus Roizmanbacteria bacterium]